MLEDNESKYGTICLIKEKVPLFPGISKSIQIGRMIMNFSLEAKQGNLMQTEMIEELEPIPHKRHNTFKTLPKEMNLARDSQT